MFSNYIQVWPGTFPNSANALQVTLMISTQSLPMPLRNCVLTWLDVFLIAAQALPVTVPNGTHAWPGTWPNDIQV